MTLSTVKRSGSTSPETRASPTPQVDSITIFERSPLTGLSVKSTPAERAGTIRCTPTLMRASFAAIPWRWR